MSRPQQLDRKVRRRRCRLVCAAVLGALVLAGVGWYALRPTRAARLAEGLLAGMTGADVRIAEARFGFDGDIELSRLVLQLPGVEGDRGRLFEARDVLIEHDLGRLLRGDFTPTMLRFTDPVIYQTEDLHNGKFNFQTLMELNAARPPASPTGRLPEVDVTHGEVRFAQSDGRNLVQLGAMRFGAQLAPARLGPAVYQFLLREQTVDGAGGTVVQGTYDPRTRSFAADITGFQFTDSRRIWLPRRWRDWWDEHEHGPAATIKHLRCGYDWANRRFFSELSVDGVSLIPPVAAFRDAGILMRGGSGRFRFGSEGVEIRDLTGSVAGVTYRIDGRLGGLDAASPLDLTVRAESLTLPLPPSYLAAMPAPVRTLIDRFEPVGTFSAVVELTRATAGGPLSYAGTLKPLGASARSARFPYRVSDLRGEIRFDPHEVRVVRLTGRGPTGATLSIEGRMWPPEPGAAEDVTVTATDLPLDASLYEALKPHQRAAFDAFLNAEAHERLVAAGLLLGASRWETDSSESPAAGLPPVFELGGRVHTVTHIRRKRGPDVRPDMTTVMDLAGVQVVYQRWPYPLRVLEGRLVMRRERTDVEGLTLQTPSGTGTIFIEGHLLRRDGRMVPDLVLTARAIPVDAMLRQSIPRHPRKWLEAVPLGGLLDASGRVFTDASGGADFELALALAEGTADPFTGLAGRATLRRGGIQIEQLTGMRGAGRLAATGHVAWTEAGQQYELDVQGRGVRFEDRAFEMVTFDDALVARLGRLQKTWQPAGVYDADLHIAAHDGQPPDYRLEIRPADLRFTLSGQRLALTDMAGSAVVTPGRVALNGLGAAFDEGRFSADGTLELGPRPVLAITVDGGAPALGPAMRDALPAGLRRALGQLHLECGYRFEGAKLVYRATADGDGEPRLSIDTTVAISGASAKVGVPVTDLEGQLQLRIEQMPDQRWSRLDIDLAARSLRVLDRPAGPLAVALRSAGRPGALTVESLDGVVAGGVLSGSGNVELADGGAYSLEVLLREAALPLVLSPSGGDGGDTGSAGQPAAAGGVLSASLGIEGRHGQPDSLRGRGEVFVERAEIHEMPLSLALLQIVNIAWPSARSFDRAVARFHLDGRTVVVDRLSLASTGMEIAGGGTMQLGDGALDLELYSSNPSGPDLGHLSSLLARVRDELMCIHVGGTLSRPLAHVTTFNGAQKSLESIFGKPKADAGGTRRLTQAPQPD